MSPKSPLLVPLCPPNPREKGRKERETLQQMAEVTREGFRLKKILIEDWKKAREEKQVRVSLERRTIWALRPGGVGWRSQVGLTPASN